MNLLITSADSLMFRDARPFGSFGVFSGGLHRWPMPGTVAGALRTRLGFLRSSDYFQKRADRGNIEAILREPLRWMLPVIRKAGEEQWQYLFPRPADAVIHMDPARGLQVSRPVLRPLGDSEEGTDLGLKDWLYPFTEVRDKPPSDIPGFWHDSVMRSWWEGADAGSPNGMDDLGVPPPPLDIRRHTAIDPKTYTAADAQLFASGGIRLERRMGDAWHEYAILCCFGLDEKETPKLNGEFHLGGERRMATLAAVETPAPAPAEIPENTKYLRLHLLTPGNFGTWAPEWLMPAENSDETPWGVPWEGFPCRMRLRSAFLHSWTPVSGWDYEKHKPKAMRKLVPAGSVYVVELEDPTKALQVRDALWFKSLCVTGSREQLDGYGVVAVGDGGCLVGGNHLTGNTP